MNTGKLYPKEVKTDRPLLTAIWYVPIRDWKIQLIVAANPLHVEARLAALKNKSADDNTEE